MCAFSVFAIRFAAFYWNFNAIYTLYFHSSAKQLNVAGQCCPCSCLTIRAHATKNAAYFQATHEIQQTQKRAKSALRASLPLSLSLSSTA